MSQVDLYLDAAERANTRRSYASAIQHFEVEWGGLLPATIDSTSTDIGERMLGLVAEANAQGVDAEQAARAAVRRLEQRIVAAEAEPTDG